MSEEKGSSLNNDIFKDLKELISLGMFIELIHPQGNTDRFGAFPMLVRGQRLALVNLNCTLPGSSVSERKMIQVEKTGKKNLSQHMKWEQKKHHINELLLTNEKRNFIADIFKRFIKKIYTIERKIGKPLFTRMRRGKVETIFDDDLIPANPDEFNICQHQLPINFHSFLSKIYKRDTTLFSFTDDIYEQLKTYIEYVVSERNQVDIIYNFYIGDDEQLNSYRHEIISRLIENKKAIHKNIGYLTQKKKERFKYFRECVDFITLNTVNETINEIVPSGFSSDEESDNEEEQSEKKTTAPPAPVSPPAASKTTVPAPAAPPGPRPEQDKDKGESARDYMKRLRKWQKKNREWKEKEKKLQEQKRKEEGMEGLEHASKQALMQLREQFRNNGKCIIPEDCEDGKTCINFNCVDEDKCEISTCNKSVSELTKQNIKLATLPCCNNKICCRCLIDYFSNRANRTQDYRNEKGEYKCPICNNSYLSYDVLRTLCYSEGEREKFSEEEKYQNDIQKRIEETKLTELEQRNALENNEVIDKMTEAWKTREQQLTQENEKLNRELTRFQAAGEREEQIKQAIEQQFNREMAEHRQKENSSNPNSEENRQRKQNILDLFQRKLEGFKLSDSGFSACPNCGSKILRGGCTDLTDHVADIYDGHDGGDQIHRVLNPPFCPQCGSHAVPKNDQYHRIQNVPPEFHGGRCAATSPTQINQRRIYDQYGNPPHERNVPVHRVPGAFWVDQIPELRQRKERCQPWPSRWNNFPSYPLRLHDGSYLNIFAILIEKAFRDKLYPPGHPSHPYYKTYDDTHSSDPLYELISVLDSKTEFEFLISLWPDWTPPGAPPNREEIERIVRQRYENPGGEEKIPIHTPEKSQPGESKTPGDFPQLTPDLQSLVNDGAISIEKAYDMMFERPSEAPAAPAPLAESKTTAPQQTPDWPQPAFPQQPAFDWDTPAPLPPFQYSDNERKDPCANFDNFLNRILLEYDNAGRPPLNDDDWVCRSGCNRENVPGLYHCADHARQIWNRNFCLGVNRYGNQCGAWAQNCGFCEAHQNQNPLQNEVRYYGGNRCIVINKKKKKKKKTIKNKKIRKAKKTKRKTKLKKKKTKKNRKQKKRRKTKKNNKKI